MPVWFVVAVPLDFSTYVIVARTFLSGLETKNRSPDWNVRATTKSHVTREAKNQARRVRKPKMRHHLLHVNANRTYRRWERAYNV